MDISLTLTVLLPLLPMLGTVAILVRLKLGRPVIFRQLRPGWQGRPFWLMKFRTMTDAYDENGKLLPDEARLTPIGNFLRTTSLDELPELFNVLKGDMSLVGPRPERPGFVEELKREIPFYEIRHTVKPGVTGWAQVRYHYGATMDDARRKHQFDLYYVKNNSLVLDLLVLIETVSVIVFREGQ